MSRPEHIPAVKVVLGLILAGMVAAVDPGASVAQNTGKIVGTIVDEQTREPLPGANVLVVGTTIGAAADLDGEFLILQAPPGSQTLRITMVGYATVFLEDVRVQSGLTTDASVALRSDTIEEDEIVVTAERPVIQKDETANAVYLDVRTLAELPVTTARQGLMIQSGVLFDPEPIIGGLGGSGRGETRYAIRGGEQNEVVWFIDGARVASLIEGRADQGGSFTNVNLHAVQEIQVLTGGFDAQYGGAQSGIVNVVTKEGGPQYRASLEYIYGPPGQKHFGDYLYDRETQKEFIDNTLPDGTLDPEWWTDERSSQVFDYRDQPDHMVYGSVGGPIFTRGSSTATFFVASQFRREAYAYPRPRDSREFGDVMGNIVWRPKPEMKLRLSGLYSKTGHSTLQENGDFTNQVKYYRGWGSNIDDRSILVNAEWTHTLTPRFYYNVRLSRYELDMRETPSEFARTGVSENPTIFGFQRYNGYPDEPFDAYTFFLDQHHTTSDLSLESSANWQFNDSNLLKAGIIIRRNTFAEHFAYRYPSFTSDDRYWLNRGLHETYHPVEFAAYVQDKMEFASMILNVGVRYDVFAPGIDWFTSRDIFNLSVDPEYDPALDPDRDQVDENGRVKYSFDNVLDKPRESAKVFHRISPRVGVSFPISSLTVLHFNYGHFYQMPALDRMFEFNYFRPEYIVRAQIREDSIAAAEGRPPKHIPSLDGDPERVVVQTIDDLQPEKTVSFEVGVVHNFSDLFVLDVTGFYKDVFDQTEPRIGIFDRRVYMWDPFREAITPNVFFASSFSGDYGDARGFEIALRSLFSHWIAIGANYSFSQVSKGRATPGTIRFDEDGEPTFVYDIEASKRLPNETTFSRPHILRANIYLRYPNGTSNSLFDMMLSGASASILYSLVSGRSFTYIGPDDPPDTRDNERLPPINQVDLRIEKTFGIAGAHALSAYVNVTNLLNTKNLRSFGDVFFDAEATKNYVEEGIISTVDGAGYDISWQTYFPKRQVRFGVRYTLR
jgi:hypothetical protein